MTRKLLVLLVAFTSIVVVSRAQPCGIDIMHRKLLQQHPELAPQIEANRVALENGIAEVLKAHANNRSLYAKTTDVPDTAAITIPVVVHVIHDYGAEDVPEESINTMMINLNSYYQAINTTNNFADVIPPFKKYVGKANIFFRLATKDPQGNPTRGITHRQTYLTNGGDNDAKYDLWAPSSYLNIWIEKFIGSSADVPGSIVVAYSQLPPDGAADPLIDGLITNSSFITDATESYVIAHEVGHYLNLLHPFGANNNGTPANGCGDDEVDDTPPTSGEFNEPCLPTTHYGLYDTNCATGYFKVYPSSVPGIDSLVDYPDTVNTQNIMTYNNCNPELMFTLGQVARMRATMANDIAKRDSLITPWNLFITGAGQPLPKIPPTADFSVEKGTGTTGPTVDRAFYLCENGSTKFSFKNHSWNDTTSKISVQWIFPNGTPATSTSTTTAVNVAFSTPGWANVMLIASNASGSDTTVKSVYVADPVATPAVNYYQEFNPGGDLAKWPMFNYYNNIFQWQLSNNAGYYDNTSIEYAAFDDRTYPANAIGSPKGDMDDLFSPAFDLTGFTNSTNVSLNFMYSGSSRTGLNTDINDSLLISYSTDCGQTWKWNTAASTVLARTKLANQGTYSNYYVPGSMSQWSLASYPLPVAAVTNNTFFRFRYKPGVEGAAYVPATASTGYSTGNNFYMDRINFSDFPLGINTLLPTDKSIAVAPNPTNSNAYVVISDIDNAIANIKVMDITGKVVFTTQQQASGKLNRIEIPQSALSVSGIYMVHVTTNSQSRTEKLVVYK